MQRSSFSFKLHIEYSCELKTTVLVVDIEGISAEIRDRFALKSSGKAEASLQVHVQRMRAEI